ncbi:NAD(+) synthase [Candidatus Falkowbacteria bacterium]|nr:NAD(+) synthase [Candidatus Falkowbacteria bacterium]
MYKLTELDAAKVVDRAADFLHSYCQENNIHYLVTGVSGGLDSAVVIALAERACELGEINGFALTSVGLIMPCQSNPAAERLGRMVIQKFGAEEIRISLDLPFTIISESLLDNIDRQIKEIYLRGEAASMEEWFASARVAQGNIKARLRMMLGTYHVARMLKGMVLSTDNLSEFWMAFWTLQGDVGDYGLIQNLLKGAELYDIARHLEVPQEILDAKPDDGNNVAGTDEEQLGAPYSVIDKVMAVLIKNGFDPDGEMSQLANLADVTGVESELVKKLARRCLAGSYKRKGPINLTRRELGLPEIAEIDF